MLIKDTLTQSLAATKRQLLWLFLSEASHVVVAGWSRAGRDAGLPNSCHVAGCLPGLSDGTAALPVELA